MKKKTTECWNHGPGPRKEQNETTPTRNASFGNSHLFHSLICISRVSYVSFQMKHLGRNEFPFEAVSKMIATGIPVEFTAHSARHAGMAAGKASGMNGDELCARSNMSSATYKKYYQRQVRHSRGVLRPSHPPHLKNSKNL